MYSYHLRVFHAVAKHGGYARAAREALFISQPAVSKHVQALEEEVGAKLFSQVGKQLELTGPARSSCNVPNRCAS
jgi:DNA-binding transcriptional LysR family regulator